MSRAETDNLSSLNKIPLNPPFSKRDIYRLEQSILSTIVYYDCLDYPLTIVEIFRYLTITSVSNVIARFHQQEKPKQSRGLSTKHEIVSSTCLSPRNDNNSDKIPLNPSRSKPACPVGRFGAGSFSKGETEKTDKTTPPLKKGAGGIFEIKLIDIISALETSETLKKIIDQKNGFYFLAGRENIVEKRIWRKKLADEKWKKIKPILALCQIIPYIRAIFVSGSLALGNTKKESDIDILVIAKYGHIWTARAFLTVFLSILGKYRQANAVADKVCANHYITNRSLAVPFHSLYNAQTYAHFFAADPISNNYMKEFKKTNDWIGKYLVSFDPSEDKNMHNETVKKSLLLSFYTAIKKMLETVLTPAIGNYLENKFRIFESGRIQKSGLYNKSGGRITISDEQLEFHPDSPEKIVVEKFNAKMRDLGFSELANLKDSGLTP